MKWKEIIKTLWWFQIEKDRLFSIVYTNNISTGIVGLPYSKHGHWTNVGSMLARRLRRRHNIEQHWFDVCYCGGRSLRLHWPPAWPLHRVRGDGPVRAHPSPWPPLIQSTYFLSLVVKCLPRGWNLLQFSQNVTNAWKLCGFAGDGNNIDMEKYPPPLKLCPYSWSQLDPKTRPANTRHWTNVGSLFGQRRRRWTNIEPTMVQCLVFGEFQAGLSTTKSF